ncbi:MAG: gliding motility-associated C-terminal domain-containing protein [Bacteroidota bacterium]|nr:gliding motility-associated C-terminal domain-containing protein [Bacteroidota bacterium]
MSKTMATQSFLKFLLSVLLISTLGFAQGQSYLVVSLNTPGDAGILSESCSGSYELVFTRGTDNQDTTLISLSELGTATLGVDYTVPAIFPIEMLPNQNEVVVPITVINDGNIEGLETIRWAVAFQNGTVSDIVNFESAIVDEYEVIINSATDTIEWCRNVPYVLLASSDAEIHWEPSEFFDDSLGTAATVRPFNAGWYYAVVGDEECGAKDSVYFSLAIANIPLDTIFICKGEFVQLPGSISGIATTFIWTPADSTLSDPNVINPVAQPTVTTTYTLKSETEFCTAVDRVVVRVDSLPTDMHIDIAPMKPYYCAGEIVALFSPSYDSLNFPDIKFSWEPFDDGTFLSDLTLYNAALRLQDTTLYIRTDSNNACGSKDSILINVVPPSIPLSVNDTTLCPGEQFVVMILSDQITEPEWEPGDGLSCTKCFSPTVTVIGDPGGTLFYQVSGMVLDCPVGGALTIHIPPELVIDIDGDNTACSGENVPLTITNSATLFDFNWSVVSGPGTLSCTNCPNPTVSFGGNETVTVRVTASTSDSLHCGAIGFFSISQGVTDQFTGPTHFACLGDTVTIDLNNNELSDLSWALLGGGSSVLSCTNCNNPVVTLLDNSVQFRFNGETTDPNFCNVSGTVTVMALTSDPAFISIEPDSGVIAQGDLVMATLMGSFSNNIMWTVNGVVISSTMAIIEFNATNEMNTVEAKFINANGCEQVVVITFGTVPPSYQIPNAFTPNGDALNDRFKVVITGAIAVEELLVFNRWGQLVYKAEGSDVEGWDGRFKDKPAASDTYVYTAKLVYPDGRVEIAKGDVALLR